MALYRFGKASGRPVTLLPPSIQAARKSKHGPLFPQKKKKDCKETSALRPVQLRVRWFYRPGVHLCQD